MKKRESTRRRKIIKRTALVTAVVLACAVATPFIFATGIVRYYAGRLGLKNVRFASATLLPWGELRLHNVVMEETDETGGGTGKDLLTASTVRVTFSWSELSGGKLQTISVEGLTAIARPGADVPISFWRLAVAKPPAVAASSPSSAPAPTTGPSPYNSNGGVWFDSLTVTGNLRVEGAPAWATVATIPANAVLPMRISIKMTGDRNSPVREIAGNIGDVELAPALPMLAARAHVANNAEGMQLTLDSATVSNVNAAADPDVLSKLGLPPLPMDVHGLSSRLDGLKLAGKISMGAEVALNLNVEIRDFSARLNSGDALLAVDHFYTDKTHLEGKWTAAAFASASPAGLFRDLAVAQTSCRWETLQANDYRLNNAVADLSKDGAQVQLTALEGMAGNAQVRASLTYDLNQHAPTQGFLRFNGVDLPWATAKLPQNLRHAIPGDLDGKVAVRLFLNGTDGERYGLRLEIDAPEDLSLRQFAALAPLGSPTRTTTAAATQLAAAPVASLSNFALRADISWNGHLDVMPDISKGRITADQLDLFGQGSAAPLPASKIRSDFSLSRGVFRSDVYADLPDGGSLSGEAIYTAKTQTLETATLSLDDIDAALFNRFLPAPWALSGGGDLDLQMSGTAAALKLAASFTGSPENVIKYGDGSMLVTGSPTVNLHGHVDVAHRELTVDSFVVQSVNAQADAALIQALRDTLQPETGGALDLLLARFQPGATMAFHDVDVNGHVLLASGQADGAVALGMFNLSTPAGAPNPLAVEEANFSATGKGPLNLDTLAQQLTLAAGQLDAKKLTLGDQVMANFATKVAAAESKLSATDLHFEYARGTLTGTADASLTSGFQKTTLHFAGVDQAIITPELAPDTFKAQGRVTGDLTLRQTAKGLSGMLTLDSDEPGRLLISRATSEQVFAPVAQKAAEGSNGLIPANFGALVVDILENYPYAKGHAVIQDGGKGLTIDLNYSRQAMVAGDPGWNVPMNIAGQAVNANLDFNLNSLITVPHRSVVDYLRKLVSGVQVSTTQK